MFSRGAAAAAWVWPALCSLLICAVSFKQPGSCTMHYADSSWGHAGAAECCRGQCIAEGSVMQCTCRVVVHGRVLFMGPRRWGAAEG